jgi:hypothetical protein
MARHGLAYLDSILGSLPGTKDGRNSTPLGKFRRIDRGLRPFDLVESEEDSRSQTVRIHHLSLISSTDLGCAVIVEWIAALVNGLSQEPVAGI